MHAWLRLIRITDFGHFLGLLLLGAFYRPSERLSALTLAVALAAGLPYLAMPMASTIYATLTSTAMGIWQKKIPWRQANCRPERQVGLSGCCHGLFDPLRTVILAAFIMDGSHDCGFIPVFVPRFSFESGARVGYVDQRVYFYSTLFYGSYLTQPTWSGSLAAIGGFLSFSVVIPQLFHEIEDFQEDQREQIATLRVATSRGLLYLLIVALALSQSASGFLLFKHELLPRPAAWAAMVLAGAHITVVIIARFGYQRTGKYRLHRLVIRYLNMLFGIVLLICFL
jgi:hypothetical protein